MAIARLERPHVLSGGCLYGYTAFGIARHVEDDVGAYGRAEHDKPGFRYIRFNGLPVERQDGRLVTCKVEAEDAGVGGVNQPQADALAPAYREDIGMRPLTVMVLPIRPPCMASRICRSRH